MSKLEELLFIGGPAEAPYLLDLGDSLILNKKQKIRVPRAHAIIHASENATCADPFPRPLFVFQSLPLYGPEHSQ